MTSTWTVFTVITGLLFIAHLVEHCTGVTADLGRDHSGFGPPGPDPLVDMDFLSRILTPLENKRSFD